MDDWRLPEDFGPGGQAIIDGLSDERDDVATTSLIVEAARSKDRLDRLNRITSGDEDTWCRVFQADGEVVLKMDTAVSEQRQLATVLRQLLAEIQRRQGERPDESSEDGLADL